ncbi:MAG: hypothetical protein Q9218_006062 [Villophora microphyllina]
MPTEDVTDIAQDKGMYEQKIHVALEPIPGDDRKSLRMITTETLARLVRPRSRLIHLRAHLYQDRVFSRHTPRPTAISVEHQASKEGRLHHHLGRLQEGSLLETNTKLLDQQSTCRRDIQAQLIDPGPLKRLARIEGLTIRIVTATTVSQDKPDPSRPLVILCPGTVTTCQLLRLQSLNRNLIYLLGLLIQVLQLLRSFHARLSRLQAQQSCKILLVLLM